MPDTGFVDLTAEAKRLGAGGNEGFVDLNAEAKRLGVGVDTSPIEAPQPSPGITDPNMVFIGETPIPKIVQKAANAGVDYKSAAPTGHFLSSLAYDSERARAAYSATLSRHFGTEVDVRVGPDTGELEYLNPETNRYTLVSPPGATLPKIQSFGGPAMVFGSEAFSGIAAGVLTRNPNAAIGAGALGAFIGEVARLSLGKNMGVNEDVSETDIINAAAAQFGLSVVSGKGGDLLFKTGRFVMEVMAGKSLSKEATQDMGLRMAEAQRLAEEINAKTKIHKLRYDLAQASNEEDFLAAREMFQKTAPYSKEYREFGAEQEAALREFYDNVGKPYQTRKQTGEALGDAQRVLSDQVGTQVARQDIAVRMKEAEFRASLASLKDRPFENTGRPLREFVNEEQAGFREWADSAKKSLNDLAGNKDIIANRRTFSAVKDIDKEVSDALFPSIEKPNRSLIGGPGVKETPPPEIPEAIRVLRESLGVESETEALIEITNKVFDPRAKFTFSQAWRAVSALKRIERVASKGLSTETPEVGAVRHLYKALEADMRESMQGSPLRAQYDDFIAKYASEKQRLDAGVVADIMTREGGRNGRFVINDESVFRRFFTPGTDRGAKELFNVVKDNPEQMQGVREAIVDFYKREVLEGGRVNINKHDQWVDRYAKPAFVFFDKNEMRDVLKPGRIEAALQAREAARTRAIERINKTFKAELSTLDNPNRILNSVMDASDTSKMGELVDALKDTPDVLRGVQSAYRERMSERIAGTFKDEGRKLSLPRLHDFLHGKAGETGQVGNIRKLFGDRYAEDLLTMEKALSVAARENVAPNRSNTSFTTKVLTGLARSYIGMFTRPGRAVTAVNMLRGKNAERVLYRAMMNPDNLHDILQIKDRQMGERITGVILSQLGGSALLDGFGYDEE